MCEKPEHVRQGGKFATLLIKQWKSHASTNVLEDEDLDKQISVKINIKMRHQNAGNLFNKHKQTCAFVSDNPGIVQDGREKKGSEKFHFRNIIKGAPETSPFVAWTVSEPEVK